MTKTDSRSDRAGQPTRMGRQFFHNARTWIAALTRASRSRLGAGRVRFPPGRLAAGAAVTVAVLAVVMFVADGMAIAQRSHVPAALVPWFRALSEAGRSVWVLAPAVGMLVAIAVVASPSLGRNAWGVLTALAVRIGFLFLAVSVPGLIVAIVKRLIGRARPERVEGTDLYFAPFGWSNDYASLPSGHSTSAFATAVALGALFPRARPVLFTLAAGIALSRIVLGMHYPSDVIAGAVCGSLGALLVRAWFAERGLGFGIGADGVVRPFAGPSLRRMSAAVRRLVAQ